MDSISSLKLFSGNEAILVIDDNDINREILSEILSDKYEVLQAENGRIGLSLMQDNFSRLAVILLDVYMPECNGFEFLEQKRKNPVYDSLPVIVMTASNSVEDEIKCLSLGASDFVTKPFVPEVMINRIKSIIRLRESSAMLDRLEKDSVTHLLSKEFFAFHATKILDETDPEQYDIVCANIQNFQSLNERYDRKYIDDTFVYLSQRLQDLIPGIILGGRIAPDVLAFLIHHKEKGWEQILKSTVDAGSPIPFCVKFGIIQSIDRSMSVATLCERTLLALNNVRERYDVSILWYDEALQRSLLKEHILLDEMENDLKEKHFRVYFQPKNDIKTERICGAEALVRWIHPSLGFISPMSFIPLFERNGFLTLLDPYVWEECCRAIIRWREMGLPPVPVSVNVSRTLFGDQNLADKIISLVDRYGIDHSLLHIELTETACEDNPLAVENTLKKLHDNGFVVELDDFGAGYSTLTSLRTFALDYMKLDMSIIRHASRTKDYSLIRFAILLAECMKLKTVAEGVETREERDALRVLGCDFVQGYYYSKPLQLEEFETYISGHAS